MTPPIALSSPMQPGTPTSSWEELNQQAKLLESDIDANLVTLSRSGVLHPQILTHLESSLAHLTSVIDAQTGLIGQPGAAPATAGNTAQRHREILAEYQRELKRTKALFDSKQDAQQKSTAANLLYDARGGYKPLSPETESSHLNEIHSNTDHVLEIAYEARRGVHQQRGLLTSSAKKLNGLVERFPVLGGVMSKIRARKLRDTLIAVGVMLLLCLFVYYIR